MSQPQVIPVTLASNTAYAVSTDDGVILIDAGPDYNGAWESALQQLAAHGLSPADVRMVCLTHGHADHAGLARRWQEAGAAVIAGRGDAYALAQADDGLAVYRRNVSRCLASHGVPPDRLDALRAYWRRRGAPRDDEEAPDTRRTAPPRWPGPLRMTPVSPDRLIAEDQVITFGGVTVQAVPCPGHTPGTVVYVLGNGDVAFTGDHLLPGVTPGPGLQFEEDRPDRRLAAQPAFRRSLQLLADMRPEIAYPGHGRPFTDIPAAVRRTLRRQDARAARIVRALHEEPLTAFQLASRFFPRLPVRYLTYVVAEVIGALDWLEDEGRVRPFTDGAVTRYRLTGE